MKRSVIRTIDNNNALCALIRGVAGDPIVDALIATLWYVAASNYIAVWLEWVSSSANFADAPSRRMIENSPARWAEIFRLGIWMARYMEALLRGWRFGPPVPPF